ncbi:MAG: crossover junction endodeoxyribonuclease RuvC [Candidatus Acetothermia bacterium]|jgi:crossover junction endodeoxyribonuclease RuvC|nr:crossover junction endodeoxyribonuclease RuvC [Candidatus Acetothermia bacterium]
MRAIRILGVDPGLTATGYAVVAGGVRPELLSAGTIRTRASVPVPDRLSAIHGKLAEVIAAYDPTGVAVEEVYLARNAPSAMATREVVGVVKLLAQGRRLYTFAPREVKKWICGSGSAPKDQVIHMVQSLVGEKVGSDHAADALAIAICALLEGTG